MRTVMGVLWMARPDANDHMDRPSRMTTTRSIAVLDRVPADYIASRRDKPHDEDADTCQTRATAVCRVLGRSNELSTSITWPTAA